MTTEPESPIIHVRLRILGRVQGVFYRASVQKRAQMLELKGWVANRPDGSVEAVVEGERHLIEAFKSYCSEGPPLARVESIQATEEPVAGHESFEIRY